MPDSSTDVLPTEAPFRGAAGAREAEAPNRWLIAGGAGFLGSHLCDALIERGHHVLCVDNLITGSADNISHLASNDAFEFREHDICDPLVLDERVDVVVNLASPASPVDYQRLPIETLDAGSRGTRNCIELALAHDARMVMASTSEVYGNPTVHPQVEDYCGNVDPVGPRSVYDEAKRFAEAQIMAFVRTRGLQARIARIFNTYGPRMAHDDGRVVSNFVVQALRGEPLTIYGDGTQTRSFCYVDDQVTGLLALAASDYVGPVNLGNPDECTVNDLARLVCEITGSTAPVEHRPLPPGDPTRRRPDISLARRELDWQPNVPLRTGLQRTVDHYRRRLAAISQ